MRISEARIFSFGKLQNKTFQFAPGINVVYGENEAGKTTLHDFLGAMLFGMEKGRGRAAAGDPYHRYAPWHAPSYYSGAIRFFVEGRPFYLERNFYHKEKREILKNEADGEELSVACGDLQMLLGGVSKAAFENTHNIPQTGAIPGKDLANLLAEYFSDAAESGDSSIQVARAQNLLEAKRKALHQKLKQVKEEKNQEIHQMMIEKELLERDCRSLQSDLAEAERELAALKRMREKEMEEEPPALQERTQDGRESFKEQQKRPRSALGAALLICALAFILNGVAYYGFRYPTPLFLGIGALSALLSAMAVFGLKEQKRTRRENRERAEATENAREAEDVREAESRKTAVYYGSAAMAQSERMLGQLRDTLSEKETRRYNLIEKIEAAKFPEAEEQVLQTNLKAVELASAEIARLSKEFYEEVQDELNGAVSGWVFRMTGGRYDRVSVTAEGKLQIHTDGMELPPEALSRGALEQIYVALRLAAGEMLTKEEPLPVFLDETFSMFDDRRLEQALAALAQKKEQIFIFTCQQREIEILEKLGITYHKIVLG